MRILVVRHGIAQDRETFKLLDDELRPLTTKGKKEFEKLSSYYKKLYPDLQAMYSSSLLRATETADMLKKKFKKKYVIIEELKPGVPAKILLKKIKSSRKRFVAIVGHEPSLSEFIGYVVAGKNKSLVCLKKGGACLLDINKNSKILALHAPKNILKIKN